MEKRYSLLSGQEPVEFRQKIKIVVALLVIAISILIVRLGYLQVVKGTEFSQKSENNSVRFRRIKPLRGLIMDRNGIVLVDNRPSFDVIYIPSKVKGSELSVEKLKDIYKSKSRRNQCAEFAGHIY
jgi:penicillin-binding protein 2